MTDLDVMKSELRDLLSCPVDWTFLKSDPEFQRHLRRYWMEVCQDYEVDGETRFYSRTTLDLWDDSRFLRAAVVNARRWRPAAKEEYIRLTTPLRRMKFADEDVYEKHYSPENYTIDRIRTLSANGVSYFYPNCGPDNLRFLMWATIACCWRRLLHGSGSIKLPYDANFICGASYGRDATHILFVADCSACICHAYPILREHISSSETIYDTHKTDWYPHDPEYIEEDIDEPTA